MRLLLSLCFTLAGCAFYQPDLTDCVLPCGAEGQCPQGLACREGLCRPPGVTTTCECTAGRTRPCGSSTGVCRQGTQTCTAQGTWSACSGSIEPSEETCDGRDNDCDGLIDYAPAKSLVTDRLPYTTYSTRLLGHDGGYFVFHYSQRPDAGDLYLLHRYDARFNELGAPTVMREGFTNRSFVSAAPGGVVAAFALGEDEPIEVRFAPEAVDAPAVVLATLVDTAYDRRIRVVALPSGARVGWGTFDGGVRLADVPWGGGAPRVFDLPVLPDAGWLADFALSSEGRYSVEQWGSDLDDGGALYRNVINDTQQASLLRSDVAGVAGLGELGVDFPFSRGRQPVLERGGALPYLSDWVTGTSKRVSFAFDLLASDDFIDVLPQGEALWGESDVILTPQRHLLGVISNVKQQSLVLLNVSGSSFDDVEVTLRNLPDNTGFGPPSLALSGDEMVGVVWSNSKGIMGRRVCPPRVGD